MLSTDIFNLSFSKLELNSCVLPSIVILSGAATQFSRRTWYFLCPVFVINICCRMAKYWALKGLNGQLEICK